MKKIAFWLAAITMAIGLFFIGLIMLIPMTILYIASWTTDTTEYEVHAKQLLKNYNKKNNGGEESISCNDNVTLKIKRRLFFEDWEHLGLVELYHAKVIGYNELQILYQDTLVATAGKNDRSGKELTRVENQKEPLEYEHLPGSFPSTLPMKDLFVFDTEAFETADETRGNLQRQFQILISDQFVDEQQFTEIASCLHTHKERITTHLNWEAVDKGFGDGLEDNSSDYKLGWIALLRSQHLHTANKTYFRCDYPFAVITENYMDRVYDLNKINIYRLSEPAENYEQFKKNEYSKEERTYGMSMYILGNIGNLEFIFSEDLGQYTDITEFPENCYSETGYSLDQHKEQLKRPVKIFEPVENL